jgi:mycothiol S-conjugate amidase
MLRRRSVDGGIGGRFDVELLLDGGRHGLARIVGGIVWLQLFAVARVAGGQHQRRGRGDADRARPSIHVPEAMRWRAPAGIFGRIRTDSLARVTERLSLLTVHAHPDDEASKGAPTLARYHDEGVHTVLVCCTGGEEGDLQNPSLREPGQPFHGLTPDEEKAKVVSMRAEELAASAEVIGFDVVEMLGYRDSGMADTEPNNHPDCFHQADIDEAAGRLVAIVRRERPQVIITYGDDQRGYPHPDHLRVHDISVLAFERAGDPDWYPEFGEPFAPSKLYYSVWSKARIMAIHELMLRVKGESPFEQEWLDRPSQDHRITTRIDITGYGHVRRGALRAHATQIDPSAAWWGFGFGDEEFTAAYPWEDWILARSLVGPIPADDGERDLFAGVSERVSP